MGTLNQGILGGFSGKVGPVSGSSWKGIPVVKSRPASVAYPGTAAQVAQTTKMSAIVALAKPMLSTIIKPLWDRFAVKQSGYNAFVSANIGTISGEGVINLAGLVVSRGSMQPVVPFASLPSIGNSLTVEWDNSEVTDPLALMTDVAYVVVIGANGTFVSANSGSTRNLETITVPVASGRDFLITDRIFLAFKAANGSRVSNSEIGVILNG